MHQARGGLLQGQVSYRVGVQWPMAKDIRNKGLFYKLTTGLRHTNQQEELEEVAIGWEGTGGVKLQATLSSSSSSSSSSSAAGTFRGQHDQQKKLKRVKLPILGCELISLPSPVPVPGPVAGTGSPSA